MESVPELAPGDRIEVLWTIEREDGEEEGAAAGAGSGESGGTPERERSGTETGAGEGEGGGRRDGDEGVDKDGGNEGDCDEELSDAVEERWWGATVSRRGADARTYVVLYDAYAEFGAAEAELSLLGPRTLADGSAGGARMHWRREGDVAPALPWALAEDGSGVVSGRALAEAVGGQDEEDGLAALGGLSAAQQTGVALGTRVFVDEFKGEMRKILETRGTGAVVTEKDMAEIIGTLKARHGYA